MSTPDRSGSHHTIYRLMARAQWDGARAIGAYDGSADDLRDGFIHLSAAHQLRGTARKHYRGMRDLVLLAVDGAALGGDLRWEVSRGGDLFPHLYASLPAGAVLWVRDLALDGDGIPVIPDEISDEVSDRVRPDMKGGGA